MYGRLNRVRVPGSRDPLGYALLGLIVRFDASRTSTSSTVGSLFYLGRSIPTYLLITSSGSGYTISGMYVERTSFR